MKEEELRYLIVCYDKYIQDANDNNRYRDGWFPVCIDEFYDCEFQEILENDK